MEELYGKGKVIKNEKNKEKDKMLSEYKPQKFTIDEYDKQISEKLKKKHPELFMSPEESEAWL